MKGSETSIARKVAFAAAITLAILALAVSLYPFCEEYNPKSDSDPGFYRESKAPGLKYEHVPGASGTLNGVHVRINSQGLRGPEVQMLKPEDILRVVVLGDSIVFGQGVPEQGSLPAHLEDLLSKRVQGREVEVINAGVRGYDMEHYLVMLRKKVLPLQPDLMVLVITEMNDPEREPFKPESDKLKKWKGSFWVKLPFVKPFFRAAYAKEVNRIFKEYVRSIYDPSGEHWDLFVRDLKKMRDMLEERGIPLIAVTFPMIANENMFAKERQRLQETLTALGLEWVDPWPLFEGYDASDLVVHRMDFHPNAKALVITAKLLAGPAAERLQRR